MLKLVGECYQKQQVLHTYHIVSRLDWLLPNPTQADPYICCTYSLQRTTHFAVSDVVVVVGKKKKRLWITTHRRHAHHYLAAQ